MVLLQDGGNMYTVDMTIVNKKVQQRVEKIKTVANAKKIPLIAAAMWVDENGPESTNKKMLAEIGMHFDEVTLDNYKDVLVGLECINVKVVWQEDHPITRVVEQLNDVINETITECWGGEDMQEFIELTPTFE